MEEETPQEEEVSGWMVTRWICPNCESVNEDEEDLDGQNVTCDCGWEGTCRRT